MSCSQLSNLSEDLPAQLTRLCKARGITGFEVLAVLPEARTDPPLLQSSG